MIKFPRVGSLSLGATLSFIACSGASPGQGPSSGAPNASVSEESVGLKALNSPAHNYATALGWAESPTGGSGGANYVVENLNDAGPGSLRVGLKIQLRCKSHSRMESPAQFLWLLRSAYRATKQSMLETGPSQSLRPTQPLRPLHS